MLGGFAGGPLVLILDETPNRNDLRCLRLTLAYRKRAVPLFCVCYAPGSPPTPMPDLIGGLAEQAAACLPAGAGVTLLADHGLAADSRRLRRTRLARLDPAPGPDPGPDRRRPGIHRRRVGPKPGASWHGPAEVFKKSGCRAATVAAGWLRDQDGPWLWVSDCDDGPRLFRRYAQRTWTEELFKDEKSSGFHWERSRVRDPEHAARQMIIIALATYMALALGSRVIEAGLRRFLVTGVRRTLSLFQIGLRWLRFCQYHDRPLPSKMSPAQS